MPATWRVAANAVDIGRAAAWPCAKDGKIEALLPLPLSGLVTEAPLEDTAAGFRDNP